MATLSSLLERLSAYTIIPTWKWGRFPIDWSCWPYQNYLNNLYDQAQTFQQVPLPDEGDRLVFERLKKKKILPAWLCCQASIHQARPVQHSMTQVLARQQWPSVFTIGERTYETVIPPQPLRFNHWCILQDSNSYRTWKRFAEICEVLFPFEHDKDCQLSCKYVRELQLLAPLPFIWSKKGLKIKVALCKYCKRGQEQDDSKH